MVTAWDGAKGQVESMPVRWERLQGVRYAGPVERRCPVYLPPGYDDEPDRDYDNSRLNLWQPKQQIEEEIIVAARTWLFAAPLQVALVLAFFSRGEHLDGFLSFVTPSGDLTPEVEVVFSLLFLLPPLRGIWFAVSWLTGR